MSDRAEPTENATPLDAATLRLRIDDRGRLFATAEDATDRHVIVRRAFPWSRPETFVSLRSKDGHELLLLESLDGLPPETRDLLVRALDAATFVPRITRVDHVDLQHGYQLWKLVTEAGPRQIRVQEREDVRFLSETRFSVKDADGNVYEIADIAKLDDHSRRELARVI